MKLDKSRAGNLLVNIVAAGFLLGALYLGITYVVIPVASYLWTATLRSAQDGYRQLQLLIDAFSQPDQAGYLLLGLILYLLPSLIAFKKKHPNRKAVLLVNLLFGWSVIGWILALAWTLPAGEAA